MSRVAMELVVVVVGSVAISASVLALPMIPTIIEREMVMVKVGEAIFIFIGKEALNISMWPRLSLFKLLL